MAVGNNSTAQFFSITNGKICMQVKSATALSVERTNKNGKLVNEEFYDFMEGTIVGIKTKDHPDYGKFWMIDIEDGRDRYTLQLKYSSGYASAFLRILPNIDLEKPVRIVPKMTEEGDKKKASLFVMQDGAPLKHFFTKDNPNGLPQMKKIKVKGKETWDDSDMMEFLEKMVFTDIVPKLAHGASSEEVSEEEIKDLEF